MRDSVDTQRWLQGLAIPASCGPSFRPALELYYRAVRNATPACLEALIAAGCCSVWICRFAALEGKPTFLALAAKRGCPCDLVALRIAAEAGNLPMLRAAYSMACLPGGVLHCGTTRLSDNEKRCISLMVDSTGAVGHVACLQALLSWFGTPFVSLSSWMCRALEGDLRWLEAFQRYAANIGLFALRSKLLVRQKILLFFKCVLDIGLICGAVWEACSSKLFLPS